MLELNKIYCRDVIEGMKLIDDKSIDLIVTDPPYNINKTTWDEINNYLKWMDNILYEFNRILKNNGRLYLMCSQVYMADIEIMLRVFFNIKNRIIWHYPQTFHKAVYKFSFAYEPIFYCVKDNYVLNTEEIRIPFSEATKKRMQQGKWSSKPNQNGKVPCDVWQFPRLAGNKKEKVDHPTQKPIELINRCVLASSNIGDLVLDPFIGSGTTAVVCKRLNRNFIGFETEKKYIDICNNRLANIPECLETFT